MWHLWTVVVCFSIAICDACAQGPAVTSELATPQAAEPQTPPPPPQRGIRPRSQAGPPQALQEQEEEEEGEETPEIELPTGPMRVEPWAISETRVRYDSDPPPKPPQPTLSLRAKLTGERLVHMVGRGELIVEEMVDDTGAVLKALADYDPQELARTYPQKAGKRMLTAGYAGLNVDVPAPSRQARKLTEVRGYVSVVYATEVEEITIDNPLQYLGTYLDHPRLNELGIKIKVIEPGEEVKNMRDTSGIALQFEGDARKHLWKAEFFDAWLKPMYARERPMKMPDGEEYLFYAVVVGKIDADVQMLMKFYPKIEEEQVRFEFKDLELP
jgi:hypothetical protein